jgi:hypothetical protein
MKYTVLLLYPDYATGNFGEDTYMTCVEAESVASAQVLAQQECASNYGESVGEPDQRPYDFGVLMVIEGDHQDIKE